MQKIPRAHFMHQIIKTVANLVFRKHQLSLKNEMAHVARNALKTHTMRFFGYLMSVARKN